MDFEDTLRTARERAFFLLEDQDGWTLSSKSNEHWTIESKLSDKLNCSIYRIVNWVKAPVNVVKESLLFLPLGRRQEWDFDLKGLIILKQIGDNTIIYVSRTNPVAKGIISPREFINIARLEETADSVLVIGCGIDYPDFEADDSFVRGISGCVFLKIETDPEKHGYVRVTMINEMDAKGNIPRHLIDYVLPGVLVSSFNKWRKFLENDGHLQS